MTTFKSGVFAHNVPRKQVQDVPPFLTLSEVIDHPWSGPRACPHYANLRYIQRNEGNMYGLRGVHGFVQFLTGGEQGVGLDRRVLHPLV